MPNPKKRNGRKKTSRKTNQPLTAQEKAQIAFILMQNPGGWQTSKRMFREAAEEGDLYLMFGYH